MPIRPTRGICVSIVWFMLSLFHAALGQAQQPTSKTSAPGAYGPWEMEDSFSKASLRGIHAVGGGIAWASGTDGTVLRTEDGGYMWQSCALPPGAEKLDFRGTWAWDANTAVVVSSGPGELSRLYKTTDGCSSWKLLYTNPDKDGFWDAIVFSDRANGLVLGDPVPKPSSGQAPEQVTADHRARRFALFSTNDGGAVWRPLTQESLQTATEASIFAASNSSLWATPSLRHEPWYLFGTGGAAGPSVYRLMGTPRPAMDDSPSITAVEWVHSPVPLASGNDSSGVFSLAFRDQNIGIAVGGDYKKPNESQGTAAYTSDGGKTWTAAAKPPHGYRSAVAWDEPDKAWIAVGTNGSDVSFDDGKTWQYLDSGNWNALSLPWVVGPEGRMAKLVSLKVAGISGK